MKLLLMAGAAATVLAAAAPQRAVAAPSPTQVSELRTLIATEKVVDTCAPLRKPFQRAKDYVRNETIKGAITGAVVGGILGALTGGRNRGQSAVAGALSGAMVAGVGSYIAAKRQQVQTQAELQAAVANDFDPEMQVYSGLARDLAALGDCRRAQIYQLRQEMDAKSVTADIARTRLAAIQQYLVADDTLVSAAAAVQTQRVGRYVQAYGMASGYSEEQVQSGGEGAAGLNEQEISRYIVPINVVRADGSENALAYAPEPVPPPRPSMTRYVSGLRSVHLMGEPSVGSAILIDVPPGEAVEIRVGSNPVWSEARWNGRSGFLMSSVLADGPPGAAAGHSTSRRAKLVHATPVAPVVAKPALAPAQQTPRREPKGPRLLQVAMIKAPTADTPQHRAAAAAGNLRSTQIAFQQNKSATSAEISDAERSLERLTRTVS